MSLLFQPLSLGSVELPNRIVVAPMCQYSAVDGSATDWHLQHLAQLAYSGAGHVVVEATAVEARGRITHQCLGLYSDENEAALTRVIAVARQLAGPTKLGIQLAHAGRKASTRPPWQAGAPLSAEEHPWPTVSSSNLPFAEGWHVPHSLAEPAAGQGAVFLSAHASRVWMLVRGAGLAASMSRYLIDRIAATENIVLRTRTEISYRLCYWPLGSWKSQAVRLSRWASRTWSRPTADLQKRSPA